ncbi:uncharacterized protein LOC135232278 [Loxodonta africana]|uniref:uncharacterized protein LOC135232278 n=1 Tax=Loxodonta africana TaxID=9785 RepID=UPI0030D32B6D
MEETPDSGLAEEIQRSQIDLGAFTWGPDASTDSVSWEITQGRSQEDSAYLSEADQSMRLSTGDLSSAHWPTVAEPGEDILGPASPGGEEQLPPKPETQAGFATVAMELEQPYESSLEPEMPVMETGGLLKENHEEFKKAEEEEKKQKIEDSVWAGVEACEKVDIRAIDIKALESTEEFEEKACENRGNRVVDLSETTEKQDKGILKIIENNRDQGLDDRVPVVNNCEIIEGSGAKPASHTDVLNLPLQTDSVSDIKDTGPEGWTLARKDIKKNLIDPPNHDTIYHAAQGGADTEEIQYESVLYAPGGGSDENQAVVLSVKREMAALSRTDLNSSLGTSANRQAWCSYKAKDSLVEWSESTVTGNCSHTINLPGLAETDSWGKDPDLSWQQSLDTAMNSKHKFRVSGLPDGQASRFTSCSDSINHSSIRDIGSLDNCWEHFFFFFFSDSINHSSIRDIGSLDNCWEHLDIVENKKELEVDLIAAVYGEQAISSCWEQG